MTVLLSFGDSRNSNTGISHIFTHGIGDLRGIYKILGGDVEVSVIFEHTCINYLGISNLIKLVKIFACVKSLGDLDSAVAAEVEEDNGVAILNSTYGCAVLCDNEGRKILVDNTGLCSVGLDSLFCACELSALAENVGLLAALNH